MTRLIPFIPFNALNYALGLTRIRLVSYVAASVVFIGAGCCGLRLSPAMPGARSRPGDGDLVQNALLGLAVLGLIGFMPRLIKRFMKGRKAAQEQAEQRTRGRIQQAKGGQDRREHHHCAGLMRRTQRPPARR